MNRFCVIAVCICKFTVRYLDTFYNYMVVLVAGVIASPGKISDFDNSVSSVGGGGYGGKGFSAGSGLKTIAQGSAEQANNAVANQHSAARQAAFSAKSTLAQAALGVSCVLF